MEQVKHTPGPWSVFEYRDSSGLCIGPRYEEAYFTAGEVRDVCAIRGGRANSVTDQHRCDAHLIAAAPDLLAAAQRVLAKLESETMSVDINDQLALADAVKKATSP